MAGYSRLQVMHAKVKPHLSPTTRGGRTRVLAEPFLSPQRGIGWSDKIKQRVHDVKT